MRAVEEMIGAPVCAVGVGPRRDQTLQMRPADLSSRLGLAGRLLRRAQSSSSGPAGASTPWSAPSAADPAVRPTLHAAPGQPGHRGPGRRPTRIDAARRRTAILALARELGADLVVIGPEAPLVAGRRRRPARGRGIACFGPAAAAARIEGSKSFAKQVMAAAGIPTAGLVHLRAREAEADAALAEFGPPYVVKDDGLAAGKGVWSPPTWTRPGRTPRACGTVVIEEFLDGPEVSLFAVTDGATAVPLLPAQDFKRAGDGDQGPNTGGMGAYAPLPWAPADLAERGRWRRSSSPPWTSMRRRGTPYRGLLYAGLSLTRGGPAGGRVQRPVRRPGDAGGAGPAGQPARAGCWPPPRPGDLAGAAPAALARRARPWWW